MLSSLINSKSFVVFAIVLIFSVAIVFGPLAIIWALNTLIPTLSIPYGFLQWLAIVVLNLTWFFKPVLTGGNNVKK